MASTSSCGVAVQAAFRLQSSCSSGNIVSALQSAAKSTSKKVSTAPTCSLSLARNGFVSSGGKFSVSVSPSSTRPARMFSVVTSAVLRHNILANETDPPKVEVILPETAYKLMGEGWTYLDVRTPEEFAASRAPGSVNVPLLFKTDGGMSPNPDFLQQVQKAFPDKSTKLIISCQLGKRATTAANKLVDDGYSNLKDIQNGFSQWVVTADLPVEKA